MSMFVMSFPCPRSTLTKARWTKRERSPPVADRTIIPKRRLGEPKPTER